MSPQEIVVYATIGFAVGYLFVRWRQRRLSGNCCGEPECPAAKEMERKIKEAVRGKG